MKRVVDAVKRVVAPATAEDFRAAVLFVCMGNICRSPTAESVFRDQVRRAGLERAIGIGPY